MLLTCTQKYDAGLSFTFKQFVSALGWLDINFHPKKGLVKLRPCKAALKFLRREALAQGAPVCFCFFFPGWWDGPYVWKVWCWFLFRIRNWQNHRKNLGKKGLTFQNFDTEEPRNFLPHVSGEKGILCLICFTTNDSHIRWCICIYLLFIYDGRNHWWISSPLRAHRFVFLFQGFVQCNPRQGGRRWIANPIERQGAGQSDII